MPVVQLRKEAEKVSIKWRQTNAPWVSAWDGITIQGSGQRCPASLRDNARYNISNTIYVSYVCIHNFCYMNIWLISKSPNMFNTHIYIVVIVNLMIKTQHWSPTDVLTQAEKLFTGFTGLHTTLPLWNEIVICQSFYLLLGALDPRTTWENYAKQTCLYFESCSWNQMWILNRIIINYIN